MSKRVEGHDFLCTIASLLLLVVALSACGSPPPTVTPVPTAAATGTSSAQPAAPGANANMPNPASVNCQQQGGKTDIRKDAQGNEVGYCVFPDQSECEEWALMHGECKPGTKPTTAAQSNDSSASAEISVTKADNGKTVQVAQGSIVQVVLEGAPGSTGYTWNLNSGNDVVLKPQFDPAKPLDVYVAGASIPGAPGAYTFKFTAARTGTAVLKFVNKQVWMQNQPQVETFGVTVVVR